MQNGRLLPSKKKDNVESQGGTSSQKSKEKGLKNSSTSKKPENHKKFSEDAESDYGSDSYEGSDYVRPTMQNRGTGGNPSFGSRMNNPNLTHQGPQFGGNPQFGGPSTFGQNPPYNPQMFPNPGRPNMPPQYMPQPIVLYSGHDSIYHPGYTHPPAPVNANDGNNQPEQNYYFAYKNGREVRVPYIKSNWWEAVDDSYQ
uniref:Uncharacterized protein n=1 Tax=Meloidogyne javanica TaxID=6303 RepID=A0A915MZX4_MELJA